MKNQTANTKSSGRNFGTFLYDKIKIFHNIKDEDEIRVT